VLAASLKGLAEHGDHLTKQGRPIYSVVTRIWFKEEKGR
jgi:hypothetical protein